MLYIYTYFGVRIIMFAAGNHGYQVKWSCHLVAWRDTVVLVMTDTMTPAQNSMDICMYIW